MGNNINPVIVTDQVKGSSWLNKLRDHVLASTPNSSGDIEVVRTTKGTTLKLKPGVLGLLQLNYKYLNDSVYTIDIPSNTANLSLIDPLQIINNQVQQFFAITGATDSAYWDTTQSYAIGDLKRVKRNEDPSHAPPGSSWVCVSPVPYNYSSAQIEVINSISDPDLRAAAQAGIRKNGVNYNPRVTSDPTGEPSQVAHKTTDGNGRYWEQIGGTYVTMSVCTGPGQAPEVWFVNAFRSGSL